MKLSVSISFAFAAAVALMSGSAQADDRILIKFPPPSGVNCAVWDAACQNYKPQDKTLKFIETHCQPGDWGGRFNDYEALAYCKFGNGKYTRFPNKHVAKASGVTILHP